MVQEELEKSIVNQLLLSGAYVLATGTNPASIDKLNHENKKFLFKVFTTQFKQLLKNVKSFIKVL